MHILFLTDNFPPEVNAPASRTHEHCREWVRAGHEVTVVTGVPNFPQGRVFAGYRNRRVPVRGEVEARGRDGIAADAGQHCRNALEEGRSGKAGAERRDH